MKATLLSGLFVAGLAIGLGGCDDDHDHSGFSDNEAPPIPAGVYSVTGDERATIYWSPLIGADVAGYNVYVSDAADGPYERIAHLLGEATDHYIASGLDNGVTLYFAVDAFDFDGNASELSSENVHDTPRPSGFGLTLFAPEVDDNNAAVDWSNYASGNSAMSVPFDDPDADFVIVRVDTILYMKGTIISGFTNDIQDFGFTESLDEVDWAPEEGWSQTQEVELIGGHSYVVWTWDDYFAKFRVAGISESSVILEWAYQATDDFDNRFELAPGRKKAPGA